LLPLMKKILFSIVPVLFVLFITFFGGSGCANIIPPQGGPRDSLPPVLVDASPADSTTNFRGNRITLTFDEYVDLQDIQQNLLFTPTFEVNPVIEARLRTITVRLPDSLEDNTTYIFNFGNAIRDINESNPLRNFVYTFSTGPYLDSLELSGRVLLAETGRVDTTLTVMLHRSLDDSAVVKRRPTYIAKLDGNGNFTFRNLPADTFALYALGTTGGGRNYLSKSQLFAFAAAPVITPADTAAITLYAYRETPATTTGVPTVTRPAATDKRLRFSTNLVQEQQDLTKDLMLTFEQPLRSFDSTKLSLSTDSVFTPLTTYRTFLDTGRKQVTVQTAWRPGTVYNLVLAQDFAEDTLGRRLLKTDTLTFTTRRAADYGRIDLRMRNIDTAQNPVLQFVQNDKVVFSTSIKSGRFVQSMFTPGEYSLRILYDTNGNGVWDPGQFFGTKRQPERVRPIERIITVKPSWENEFEISL
jgi:hypothetical protein